MSEMEEPITEENRSYAEIAEEVFGDQFKHEPDGEAEEESENRPLTLDEAYQRMKEERGRRADEAAEEAFLEELPEEHAIPKTEDHSEEEASEAASWTDEDVQSISAFQQSAQQFQQDLAAFAQFKEQTDLNAIARDDKAKAAALRTQLYEAEQELRQRYESLAQWQGEFQHKVTERQQKQLQKHLKREQEKLAKAVPDLDKKALRSYLIDKAGFTKKDVDSALDHRLVALAEKARRYDEMMAKKKVPKARVKGKGNVSNLKTGEPDVKELRRRLEKTGRIDDAVAFLRARRSAR